MHAAGRGDGGECWASTRPSDSPEPRVGPTARSKDVSTWEVASQGTFVPGGGMCFGVRGKASPPLRVALEGDAMGVRLPSMERVVGTGPCHALGGAPLALRSLPCPPSP